MDQENKAGNPAASGREARRRFLKNTSGAAVAIPAAVLLLSASRANAIPRLGYGPQPDFQGPD